MNPTRQSGSAAQRSQSADSGEPEADPAVAAVGAAAPLVSLTPSQVAAALSRWASRLARDPVLLAARTLQVAAEDFRIAAGVSAVAPDTKDRRFADPAWSAPVWRHLQQAYLSRRAALLGTVDELDLDAKSAERARFALMQVSEALAPTNLLFTNPAAMRRAKETSGRSLLRGARHLSSDLVRNGGLPRQVDTAPFRVGETVGVTPGAVVERTDHYELLQYGPATERVRRRPLVIVSPQINKYYFLDMAPGRSFVQHAVSQGLQVFMVSWRSAMPAHRHWGIDAYVGACRRALETACEITGSNDALAIGFCAGGMTLAMTVAHLAALGNPLVAGWAMAVSMIDTEATSSLNAFLTERSAAASVAKSRRSGVLSGRDLAKAFSWVRPNDLVWNYWVSNYLMGETPPAFDVLAWNADTTNLPAEFHAGLIDIMLRNALMRPGDLEVLGTPVDLSAVTADLYLLGAATDHLVPWQSVYGATQVHGGDCRFVLSNSGHIQALINPPGNPKASFFAADEHPPSAEGWRKVAAQHQGSWWSDWAAWTLARAGEVVPAVERLGSDSHPVLGPAPGRYVHADRHGNLPAPMAGGGDES